MRFSWLWRRSFQSSIKASQLLLYVGLGIRPRATAAQTQAVQLTEEEERFYELRLRPQAMALEEERQQKLRKFRVLFYAWMLLIVGLLYVANNAILPLIFAFLSYRLILMYLKSYQQNYKEQIVPQILQYYDPTWQYSYEAAEVDTQLLHSYLLLPLTDTLHLEDHIRGHYQGSYFEIAELGATNHIRKKDDKLMEKQIFRGLSLIMAMRKPLEIRLFIVPDGEPIYNEPYGRLPGLASVKLESPKFERVFDVYATDQVQARYLLNPSQMERILDIAQFFDNYKIKFSFNGDSFQVLIPSQRLHFEFNAIFQEVTLRPELRQVLDDCKYIMAIFALKI